MRRIITDLGTKSTADNEAPNDEAAANHSQRNRAPTSRKLRPWTSLAKAFDIVVVKAK